MKKNTTIFRINKSIKTLEFTYLHLNLCLSIMVPSENRVRKNVTCRFPIEEALWHRDNI